MYRREQYALTLVAVLARTLYCSSTRARSASLGILKRVIRSMGAIVLIVWRVRSPGIGYWGYGEDFIWIYIAGLGWGYYDIVPDTSVGIRRRAVDL